jgi:hypothetical protein
MTILVSQIQKVALKCLPMQLGEVPLMIGGLDLVKGLWPSATKPQLHFHLRSFLNLESS